jgi:polar amino acid transport system substrate-binding protein
LAFTEGGKVTGFCIEVLQEIQLRIGNATPIQVMPWARAFKMAKDQQNVALVCPKRTEDRIALFKWVGPMQVAQTNFYAKKGSGIRIKSLEDAKKIEGILVPREFYSYQFLIDKGFQNLEPVNTSENMTRMLLAGRRPLMVTDPKQLDAMLKEAHASNDVVELVGSVLRTLSYMTLPRNTPDNTVKRWQAALDAMKDDGSFARLHEKWFPGDEADLKMLLDKEHSHANATK